MTEPIKFDPVKEFVTLRDNISKVVGHSIKSVTGALAYPAIDVYETEEAVVVVTQPLIGLEADSTEVSMEHDILIISGTTVPNAEIPQTAYLHREIQFGTFTREIRIPRLVKASDAAASFKNRVLSITLPKVEVGSSQVIDVAPIE